MRRYWLLVLLALLALPAQAQQPSTPLQVCQQIAGNQIGQISELAAQLQTANAQIAELKKQGEAAKSKEPTK